MATTYLTQTPSSTSTRKKLTFSAWCKRANINSEGMLIHALNNSSESDGLRFYADNSLNCILSNGNDGSVTTNRKFRDPNAFYHIMWVVDTTQGTASDRIKLYVNGIQETSFSSASYPSQDFVMEGMFVSAKPMYIGTQLDGGSGSNYFGGVMSYANIVDGTAYTPSTFGSTDSVTGQWKINTSPSVTYGTNGSLILKNGNTITDQSGNSNNWTLAAGTLTNTEDCPSNVFATLNPLYVINASQMPTLTNGNTTGTSTSSGYNSGVASIAPAGSGKYYSEHKLISGTGGWATNTYLGYNQTPSASPTSAPHDTNFFYGVLADGGAREGATNKAGYAGTWTSGDIIQLALDLDNNRLYVGKNGLWADGSGNWDEANINAYINLAASPAVAGENWFMMCGDKNTSTATWGNNFGNGYFGTTAVASAGTNASGNGIFEYDVPTGYTALSTKGLNL